MAGLGSLWSVVLNDRLPSYALLSSYNEGGLYLSSVVLQDGWPNLALV